MGDTTMRCAPNAKDYTGLKKGMLTVLGLDRREGGKSYWKCICDCNNVKVLPLSALLGRRTNSCGCLREAVKGLVSYLGGIKHGLRFTPEYHAWVSMKGRCLNPRHIQYVNYGGRGIKVCKRWQQSPVYFADDMGRRPSKNHSLDRINNDGNYCKSNCRWATRKQQQRNRRLTRRLRFGGENLPLIEWAERLGVTYNSLYNRIYLWKWTKKEALTTPKRGRRRNRRGNQRD